MLACLLVALALVHSFFRVQSSQLLPFVRGGHVMRSAAARYRAGRLAATPSKARKAEARLLPSSRVYMTVARPNAAGLALQSRLGLSEEELKKVALALPAVLSPSMEANVLPLLAALQSRLGLSEAELKKVVLIWPAVLGLSIEANVLPSLAALQSRLELSDVELKNMVVRLPSVLSYSIEANVLPKLDWLQQELKLSVDALRAAILAFPARLGYSLDRRYRPRLRACRLAGAEDMTVLRQIAMTDARFCELIGVSMDALSA